MKKLIIITISIIFTIPTFSQINIKSIPPLFGVYSTDSLNVWAIGEVGTIIHSIDGGNSWTDHSVNTVNTLRSIDFSSETNGFIVGDSGLVFETEDGGNTWNNVDIGATENFHSIDFTDEKHAWITGYNTGVYRTINGGDTWELIHDKIEQVSFIDSLNGWGIDNDWDTLNFSGLHRTTDGGLSWENILIVQYEYIRAISFCDSMNGFYSYQYANWGGTYKSLNGGIDWVYTYLSYYITFKICFPNIENIWISCDKWHSNSDILYSTDLFGSYDIFNLPDWEYCLDISARGMDDGWAVGSYSDDYGKIWKLTGTNEWIQVTTVGINENHPDDLEINCFPNPTNSLTNIALNIQDKSNLFITLHSLNGQKIQDIFSGIKQKGKHQFTLDCSNFSKGIYLVKAQVGKELESIKLVVK